MASETVSVLARTIGPALRLMRERRGRKQYVVASDAGVTKAMLSAYETGKRLPSIRTLDRLLTALDARLLDLGRAVEQARRTES